MRKTAFIGHRMFLPIGIEERVNNEIINEVNSGCTSFIMGTHGNFDKLALSCCRNLRKSNKDIDIEVVITSLHQINPKIKDYSFGNINYPPYEDVKTTMYEIENVYFKQIIASNKHMIDTCDTLICYVRPNEVKSGAKTAMNYAKRKGLRIVNLYSRDDG